MRSFYTSERVFRKVVEIDSPVDTVWEHVTSQKGINDELAPFLKMTMPRRFKGRSIADVAAGTHVGKSLLLLFRLLPFGFDDITITRIEPGRMFREESVMTGMRVWTHHRILEQAGGKTIVTDEVSFAPCAPMGLIPGWGQLMARILFALFTHRHHRLERALSVAGR